MTESASTTPPRSAFHALGEPRFIALTTYRENGDPVVTPVWVVPDGDALGVSTPAGAHKLGRLDGDPSVTVQPCGRRGAVEPGAPTVRGRAEILPPGAATDRVHAALGRRYGWQWRVALLVERLLRRGAPDRVVLLIHPSSTAS